VSVNACALPPHVDEIELVVARGRSSAGSAVKNAGQGLSFQLRISVIGAAVDVSSVKFSRTLIPGARAA
jgi:hypothetical protein